MEYLVLGLLCEKVECQLTLDKFFNQRCFSYTPPAVNHNKAAVFLVFPFISADSAVPLFGPDLL